MLCEEFCIFGFHRVHRYFLSDNPSKKSATHLPPPLPLVVNSYQLSRKAPTIANQHLCVVVITDGADQMSQGGPCARASQLTSTARGWPSSGSSAPLRWCFRARDQPLFSDPPLGSPHYHQPHQSGRSDLCGLIALMIIQGRHSCHALSIG